MFTEKVRKVANLIPGPIFVHREITYRLLTEVSILTENAIFQFLASGLTVSNYYWVKRSSERPVNSNNEKSTQK